ncbi:MAG: nucleotidyltransferase [Spirochaetaceae bacterium]|nr:MAG: nucleotidyltransferase [Spirochaetaceae bacterium]
MAHEPTLVVLAAGMGSRYGGLKQVDPVGPHGETILDYSVFDAMRAGFGRVVFVIRRDIEEEFRAKVGSRFEGRLPVDYAFQSLEDLPDGFPLPEGRSKPWGTAHAVWAARNAVSRNFAVINADDYYGSDAYRVLAGYLQSTTGDHYAMVGYRLGNTLSDHGDVNRAVCRTNAHGELVRAVETLAIERDPDAPDRARFPSDNGYDHLPLDTVVSMNMFGFTTAMFAHIETHLRAFLRDRAEEPKAELYIPTVVNKLIERGEASMQVLTSDATWFGVTYAEDKPHVQEAIRALIAAGRYETPLWD